MITENTFSKRIGLRRLALSMLGALVALGSIGQAATKTLPSGSRIYLTLDQAVSSDRGDADVGMTVACRVWRDVDTDGVVFIRAGTPASCRVEKVKRNNIGGVGGKLAIGGVETRSVDGQTVIVQGGYNKEGGERKTVVWVATLFFWPFLFFTGDSAELSPGTVFDVVTVNNLSMEVASDTRPRLNLAGLSSRITAEILLDDFISQKSPDVLKIRAAVESGSIIGGSFKIDSVNGSSIEPLTLGVKESSTVDGATSVVCEVKIKPLAKHFRKGINRFEVAYSDGSERIATEVVLDIEI